ncbi:MAG: tRNA uridine(34) 5-carboxymethylaminomethyl modification radical SAM/GNAT enzyme Elp3 [Candidatus Falkowbacteria bacterium]|nr:tRNA uridine(34) 5-carboxymethylaminomethyl modification radical SAM/GNAT enzyme Elp3 [Candidatus Falkowbacteria bacterium]
MLKIIQELLQEPIQKREELLLAKRKIAKKYKLQFFENSEILKGYHALLKKKAIVKMPDLERILRRRSIRTLSGIASVSVLTKPFGCPNNCAYCPTEIRVPKSYLSNEPAVMRAIRFKYDAYNQVQGRIKSLVDNGHAPTKIELIVIGGTWSSLPEKYKYWYILECFQGANNFKKNQITPNKSKLNEKSSLEILKQALLKEQRRNEKAKYRIIGLTLETRPDWINEKELAQMRMMGYTRVEIGVQLTDDAVLSKNNRGHGVAEIVLATKMLRDWGFKITYHWMPGLPGSNPALDIQKFKELFTNENFQPDQIKFYPTIVVKNSLLYTWWKQGKYIPYTSQELEHIITECKQVVPPYVRIIRLIRDIPGNSIIAGNKITNLNPKKFTLIPQLIQLNRLMRNTS